MALPKMSEAELDKLGLTDQWDESRLWERVSFGCRYEDRGSTASKIRPGEPVGPYPGAHQYKNRKTGETVVVRVTHERHWLMPASVDSLESLYGLDGVVPSVLEGKA